MQFSNNGANIVGNCGSDDIFLLTLHTIIVSDFDVDSIFDIPCVPLVSFMWILALTHTYSKKDWRKGCIEYYIRE